jgi:hypothetical protein
MVFLFFVPACPGNDNVVGALDPNSPDATDTGGSPSIASPGNFGAPCVLAGGTSPREAAANDQAPECSSGLCVKPLMLLEVENVDTGPSCSKTCQSDDDCSGAQARDPANPSDKTCKTGYTCGVSFVVGPLCCKKFCLCKDFTGGRAGTVPLTCEGPEPVCAR